MLEGAFEKINLQLLGSKQALQFGYSLFQARFRLGRLILLCGFGAGASWPASAWLQRRFASLVQGLPPSIEKLPAKTKFSR